MAVGEAKSRSQEKGGGFDFGAASPASNRRSTRYYALPQPNWERPLTHDQRDQKAPLMPSAPSLPSQPSRAESQDQRNDTPDSCARVCTACDQSISGHFVRALGASWHMECFTCGDCGNQCAQKFFQDPNAAPAAPGAPSAPKASQRPLCERCYFRRLDLLCFRCNDALRGSYITALDRKYHVEHFTCSECPLVFGPDDSYYEHEGNVYCQYHYSCMYAASCQGCSCAILKQFVETYRGGVEHHWHPECYMIFKFWNVRLSTAIMAGGSASSSSSPSHTPSDSERLQVAEHDKYMDQLVLAIWSTLCGFEETTASSISQMLQCAVNKSFSVALSTSSALVASVRVLFEAIEELPLLDSTPRLNKEPKTLCRKIVAYMSAVSKLKSDGARGDGERTDATDLLSVANSLAHYLKVLIRYGLSTALSIDYEHKSADHPVLHRFLRHVSRFSSPPAPLEVSALTSDRCVQCEKTVEDNCVCSRDRLWHTYCFQCKQCGQALGPIPTGSSGIQLRSTPVGNPLCEDCAEQEKVTVAGDYIYVGRLSQFMFLLYVAIARFELVLGQSSAKGAGSTSSPALGRPSENLLTPQLPTFRRGSTDSMTRGIPSSSSQTPLHATQSAQSASQSANLSATQSAQGHSLSSSALAQSSTHALPQTASAPSQPSATGESAAPVVPSKLKPGTSSLERTSDLLHSKAALTLDDIRRIVASEQAREQMPNAYRHQEQPQENMLDITIKEPQQPANYFAALSLEDKRLVAQIARAQLAALVCPGIMSEEDLACILSPSKSIWAKMGKALQTNKPKRFGVFGIELETLIEKSGVDSALGAGSGYTLRIPSFLEEIIGAMHQKNMGIEGVFRKNGNIKRIRDFQDIADKGVDIGGMLCDENIIQLAALFKTFLRSMPTPLLGNRVGRLFPHGIKLPAEQREQYVRLLVCVLEPAYRDVLEVLMTFLNWCASFSNMDEEQGSKMDAHNLATVITPNILPGAKEGTQPDHYLQAIEATALLIKNHQMTAHVPPDVWSLYTKCRAARPKDKLSQREVQDMLKSFS